MIQIALMVILLRWMSVIVNIEHSVQYIAVSCSQKFIEKYDITLYSYSIL